MSSKYSRPANTRLPSKTTLICPTCGHESQLEGDWTTRRESSDFGLQLAYECPDCETVITRRPLHE